ncbi:hypothetical protein GCM10022288_21320 [Gryllotalpicola kribbensis]|uniref:Uncharacterized protein n=1 Tax=Gryllotalpicola kribbensis TaxID=993084 RepID=A0ABP8AUT5_9MICO
MPVRSARSDSEEFAFVLPGSWASIPLADADARAARISALVKQQFGTNDRLASRRRQFREELAASAKQAADAGAAAFSLSLELFPGIPVSGAMISVFEAWPAAGAGIEDTASRLAAAYPEAEVLETDAGPIARKATAGTQTYTTTTTPSLDLDYWVPAPGGSRVLATNVSLPIAPDPGPFTELFDSVISSIVWAEPVR